MSHRLLKRQSHQVRQAHSYQSLVPFYVTLAGQAVFHIQCQAIQLDFQEASKAEQHRSQEEILLLSFTAGRPEPAHGQQGAQGLSRGLVLHEELNQSGEVQTRAGILSVRRWSQNGYTDSNGGVGPLWCGHSKQVCIMVLCFLWIPPFLVFLFSVLNAAWTDGSRQALTAPPTVNPDY